MGACTSTASGSTRVAALSGGDSARLPERVTAISDAPGPAAPPTVDASADENAAISRLTSLLITYDGLGLVARIAQLGTALRAGTASPTARLFTRFAALAVARWGETDLLPTLSHALNAAAVVLYWRYRASGQSASPSPLPAALRGRFGALDAHLWQARNSLFTAGVRPTAVYVDKDSLDDLLVTATEAAFAFDPELLGSVRAASLSLRNQLLASDATSAAALRVIDVTLARSHYAAEPDAMSLPVYDDVAAAAAALETPVSAPAVGPAEFALPERPGKRILHWTVAPQLLKHPRSGGLPRPGMESLLVALEDCCRAVCAFEKALFEAGLCALAMESSAALRAESEDDYCILVLALQAAQLTSYFRGILAVKGYGQRVRKLLGRADFDGVVRGMPAAAQEAHRVAWGARRRTAASRDGTPIIGLGVRASSAGTALTYVSRIDLSGAAAAAAAVRTAADWWCLELQLRREALLVDLGSCVDVRKALPLLPASLVVPAARLGGGPTQRVPIGPGSMQGDAGCAENFGLGDIDGF